MCTINPEAVIGNFMGSHIPSIVGAEVHSPFLRGNPVLGWKQVTNLICIFLPFTADHNHILSPSRKSCISSILCILKSRWKGGGKKSLDCFQSVTVFS